MTSPRQTTRRREPQSSETPTGNQAPEQIETPAAALPQASPPRAESSVPSVDPAALEELAGMDASVFSSLMDAATSSPSSYSPGQEVSGLIVRLDSEKAFIDLGGKAEAQIPLSDLSEGELQVGASITARVLKIRDEGILLARNIGGAGAPALMIAAMETGIPVEGRVESRNTGGYVVNLSGVRAFCPISQIDRFPGRDLDVFLNRNFQFRIMDIRGRDVIISRRAIQEVEIQANREKIWETLTVGATIEGVVTSVRDYGAFVDLGGVEGLIHKTEISWEETADPNQILHRWDRVTARVIEIDPQRHRIALSLKDPNAGPWAKVGSDFQEGEIYEGKVVKIVDFGAFVELAAGVTGLVRFPNLSWDRVEKTADAVALHQVVKVKVLEIDKERERLDLGIKQAVADPAETMAETWQVGAEVTGVIQQVSRMGLALRVNDEMDAWLPSRDVQLPPGVLIEQRFRKGGRITARIVEVDKRQRKLKLTQSSSSEADEREAVKRFEKEQSKSTQSLGTFAELLSGFKAGKR